MVAGATLVVPLDVRWNDRAVLQAVDPGDTVCLTPSLPRPPPLAVEMAVVQPVPSNLLLFE